MNGDMTAAGRLSHLILPCETRFREFDAKLLLACHAAERGWRVTIGDMRVIDRLAARLPRGVYVGKGLTRRQAFPIRTLPRLGHVATAWDEEGLVYVSPQLYRASRVDARALNAPVRLFAWGNANAEAWRGHPDYAGGPISITGNPRADLLRPELRGYFSEEARRLRVAHGSFILINSNFASLNHYLPKEGRHRKLLQDRASGAVSDDDPQLGFAIHKEALFRHFLEIVPALARRFPEHKIILRPHPSENPAVWREVVADCPNAEVVYEGNVAAWLLSAAALVHNGCTTAIESFLLDRPAIAYRPVVSERYDLHLPNSLSVSTSNPEELFRCLTQVLRASASFRDEALAERRATAQEHIASCDGPSSCERILEALEEVAELHSADRPQLRRRLAAQAIIGRRQLAKRIRRSWKPEARSEFVRHMFPPVGEGDVAASIRRLGAVLGRFDELRLEKVDHNLFEVSRA